jgi:hypothetical protein
VCLIADKKIAKAVNELRARRQATIEPSMTGSSETD